MFVSISEYKWYPRQSKAFPRSTIMAAHVDVKRVVESIKALRTIERKHQTKKSVKNILDEDTALEHDVYLQFTLKKIPYNKSTQWIKINLPHSLETDKSEICLFTGDLDKKDKRSDHELTVDHYKELLADAGITRNVEIIPLRQLRTEYTPYESKRNLCAGYDVFLGDSKILPLLHRLLGKTFFAKNKLPRRIDLTSKHLRRDIEGVLSSTELPLRGEGTTSTVKVCNLAMSDTDAAENVMAACETLGCRLPGGWPNVLSLHIKTQKSPGLPLYMSFSSRNDIRLPKPRQPDDDVEGDLTTIPGARVTVKRSGQVTLHKGAKDLTDETLGDKRLRRLLEIQEQGAEEVTRQFELKARCRKLLIQSTLRNKKSRNNRLKASRHPAPQKKATKTKKQVGRPRKKAAKQK
ncbi:ribosomal L1 domain-containing protein 1-like [Dermacentor andersoni]|uniref:ribosomal L1 domain-containing protein 1-like n=1 Tax=Dermacentor andersoni TaxID=34620 RepID=UPI003B3BA7B1